MDAREEIEGLVAFEGRAGGTDSERRAGDHLVRRLRALGRHGDLEPFWTWPGYAPTHLIHVVLAVIGGIASVGYPLIGAALLLAVLVSTVLDVTGRGYLARRLTPQRASQNVVSYEDGGKPGVLVLVAHYDAARTGLAFAEGPARALARARRLLRLPLGPFQVLLACVVLLLGCALFRALKFDSVLLNTIQFVPTAALMVGGALLAGITVSSVVPGANDNASGVATALRLAGRHGAALEHFDLWVVLPGSDEGLLLGMHRWMRRHRRMLDQRRTIFLGIDGVGAGTVRYARREGFVLRKHYNRRLVALCREVAGRSHEIAPASASSVHASRRRGFPALAMSGLDETGVRPNHRLVTDTPDRVEPDALDRAFELCSEIVERIDREVGPDVAALDGSGESAATLRA